MKFQKMVSFSHTSVSRILQSEYVLSRSRAGRPRDISSGKTKDAVLKMCAWILPEDESRLSLQNIENVDLNLPKNM